MDVACTENRGGVEETRLEQGFWDGVRTKAIRVRVLEKNIPFNLGYFLWGADIWLGKIPFLKSLILANGIVWV